MPSIIDDFNGAAGVAAHVANPAWSIFGYGSATKLYHNGDGGLSCDAGVSKRGIQFNTGSNRNSVEFVVGADFSVPLSLRINLATGEAGATGLGLMYDSNAANSLTLFSSGTVVGTLAVKPQVGDTVRLELDSQLKTCKYYLNGTLQQTISFTGVVPETATYVNLVTHKSDTPALNDLIRYFKAEPLPELDDIAPTFTGTITVDSRSTNSITTTCPEATDNVAVAGYEVRINSGAWVDKSLSRTHAFTGLPVGAAATIEWRARDAANNYSAVLSVAASSYGSGATANSILLTTGPQDGNPKGLLYDLAGTVAAGDWLNYEVISGPTPPGGTFSASPMGAFSYVGPAPAVMVIQPSVNGVPTAETITVNLYDQAGGGDTESPVLSGAITVNSKTQTTVNVSCPTATDNVAVSYYEWSSNGGTSWVTGTTTHNFTGLTAGTQYQIRVRAADAAGNKSAALSLAVTTEAEAPAAPDLTGSITLVSKTATTIDVSCPAASGSVTGYEWSQNGGTSWVTGATTHSFTGLSASTLYDIRVRAVGPGGTSSSLSTSITTDAVGAGATLTVGPQVNNTTTVHANVAGITAHVYAVSGALVVTKTAQTTNASGVMSITDSLLAAGTTYRVVLVYGTGEEGMAKVVAS